MWFPIWIIELKSKQLLLYCSSSLWTIQLSCQGKIYRFAHRARWKLKPWPYCLQPNCYFARKRTSLQYSCKYASYPYTWMRYALWILLSMPGNEIWRENYKTYVLHTLRLPKLRKSYANAISRYAISEVKIKSDFDQLIIALVQNEDKKIQTDTKIRRLLGIKLAATRMRKLQNESSEIWWKLAIPLSPNLSRRISTIQFWLTLASLYQDWACQ